jgi:hypothetical protein
MTDTQRAAFEAEMRAEFALWHKERYGWYTNEGVDRKIIDDRLESFMAGRQAAQAAGAGREATNAEFQEIIDALALNPSEWNYDSNMTPFYNDTDGHSRGGNCDGTYCVYGDDFEIDGERYEGPVLTERCGKADAMFIAACKPRVIRALLDRACSSDAGSAAVALDSPVECTCSDKDMTFGRCCKLASNNALSEVEPIVNEWLRNRGTSMDGAAYGAALDLAAFVKSRIVINAELVEALEVAQQAFVEMNHARTNPDWFTKGKPAADQHYHHWLRKASDAVRAALSRAKEQK